MGRYFDSTKDIFVLDHSSYLRTYHSCGYTVSSNILLIILYFIAAIV